MSILSVSATAIHLASGRVASEQLHNGNMLNLILTHWLSNNALLALTGIGLAFIFWVAWRYKAGNWVWLFAMAIASVAVLVLPNTPKPASHVYVLTNDVPMAHENLAANSDDKSETNAAPTTSMLSDAIENTDAVVIDLRKNTLQEQMQALHPYQQARTWTIIGNELFAKEVMAFSAHHLSAPSNAALTTPASAFEHIQHSPAIHWQSAYKSSALIHYPQVVPAHSAWTLRWALSRESGAHQASAAMSEINEKLELQLLDSNEQVISRGKRASGTEIQLHHQFSAQGHYNFQLRVMDDEKETQRIPISVFVSPPSELNANLYFSSPSFEWRALKRWLERSNISYQSHVKTAKEFNRRDVFGTRIAGSASLELFDERRWLAQSKAEIQAREERIRDGAIVIIAVEAGLAKVNNASVGSESPNSAAALTAEDWRKQELRLFGPLAANLNFASASRLAHLYSATLGRGGVILIREPEWHRVGISSPDVYGQAMAHAIGSLWQTSSVTLSEESELRAQGQLSRLCVDNANIGSMRIDASSSTKKAKHQASESLTLALMASAYPGQYCAHVVFDSPGWFELYFDPRSDNGVEPKAIRLGDVFIPETGATLLDRSRQRAALSFYESDSEPTPPSRFSTSRPTWRAWALFGLFLVLSVLWWRDQKKSVSNAAEYSAATDIHQDVVKS